MRLPRLRDFVNEVIFVIPPPLLQCAAMPEVAVGEIVELVRGEFSGDRTLKIRAVRSLEKATEDSLSFLTSERAETLLESSRAAAILVPQSLAGSSDRWIRVPNPALAFAAVVRRWFDELSRPSGISPLASIARSAKLGKDVGVGPFVTIGEGVVVGDRATIYQGTSVEKGSVIDEETLIYPNVTIYHGTRIGRRCIIHSGVVIGSDGYGFVQDGGRHHKVPQIGIVRIEDDVEIGANCTIDRAALDETVIGEGTKIDNLVHIAHNVRLGKHCLLVAQVGIAGSTEIGDYVVFGGQSGAAGHIRIGSGVQVAAKAGVMKDFEGKVTLAGFPARPLREQRRSDVAVQRLPELEARVAALEKKARHPEERSDEGS